MSDDLEIYCPKCQYRPVAEDRWGCMPSCGAHFHTFWTRGMCPKCAWNWKDTQCPHCEIISPHEKWYHPKDGVGQNELSKRTEPVNA